jgi:hypothetical protein
MINGLGPISYQMNRSKLDDPAGGKGKARHDLIGQFTLKCVLQIKP